MSQQSPDERIKEFDIPLNTDREWHSKPIRLKEGSRVTITATSRQNFYAGLFPRDEYIQRASARGPFSFPFGADRASFTKVYDIEETDDYYLVFRVGVFSQPQTIHVRWILESDEDDDD